MSIENLPTYGPTEVFREEDTTPDVVVRVAFALSREQLMTALTVGFTELVPDVDAETLTVEQTRSEVEGWLHSAAVIELDRYVVQGRQSAPRPEAQPVLDALTTALDRAYPANGNPTVADLQSTPEFAEEFPLVAAHLARERGESTVTVDTRDHGRIEVEEPFWCLGVHADGEYRDDFNHQGEEHPLVADTACHGRTQMATASLYQRPFSVHGSTAVVVALEFDSSHEYDSTSLAGLADSLVAYSVGPLHGLIERLQLLEGEAS